MTPRALAPAALIALACATGCAAIYPRYTTSLRDAPPGLSEGGELTPPPDEVQRIAVTRAEVPRQTRDARSWDDDAGPDPYVVLLRNGTEIFRTRTQQNTFNPEWNGAREFVDARVRDNDTLRIELRDDDGLTSELVGALDVRGVPGEARNGGIWMVRLEGGAVVQLTANPPPPRLGMGVTYEYRGESLVVVSVEEAGPAYAGGLRAGDRIMAINGRAVSAMSELEVRDAMDRASVVDTTLAAARNGGRVDVNVRRDAVYPAR